MQRNPVSEVRFPAFRAEATTAIQAGVALRATVRPIINLLAKV